MTGWWAASYAVLWLLVLMLCIVVVALARQIGTLHLRLGPRGALEIDDEGPALGEAPSPVDVKALDGTALTIGGVGRAQLLLFVSPGCRVCREVLPGVGPVARAHDLDPIVIAGEHYGESGDIDPAGSGAMVVASAEAMSAYAVPGTHFAVIIDGTGVVRSKGTVNNLEQLEGLADTARRRRGGAPEHSVG